LFDLSVFTLTVEKVAFLQIFIFIGYFLRRKGILGKDACKSLSFLCTHLFLPAYTIVSLPKSFAVEKLGGNAILLSFSLITLAVSIIAGRLAGRFLAQNDGERRAFSYLFTFANSGYFGLPVVKGVFGEEILGQFLVFYLPFSIAIHSYGWGIFASKTKFEFKKAFLSPTIIATYFSAFLGLTGIQLPGFLQQAMESASDCMSPSAMLLAGLVMGAKPLKELVFSLRPYLIECIRIVSMPLIIGVPLYLAGVRGVYYFFSLIIVSLPAGMNVIVFPESHGQDASNNSKLVFISTLLSLITVPLIFSLAKILSGITV